MTGADGSDRGEDCLAGGGEMGRLMRARDWAATALGPVRDWPRSLKTVVSVCLNSRFPIVLWWGPDLRLIYNDAWRPALGTRKHPALGKPGREVWPEIWHIIGPMLEGVLATGQATWADDMLLLMDRHGYLEESYWTYSYSPVRDEHGRVGGVFTAVNETTLRYIGERRLRTLRELAAQASSAKTAEEACRVAHHTLSANPADVPFALTYLVEDDRRRARLVGSTPLPAGTTASPTDVDLAADREGTSGWPLAEVVGSGQVRVVDDVIARFGEMPRSPWPVAPERAVVLPLRAGQDRVVGVLVLGVNPCRALDDDHRSFHDLVAGHVAAAVANALAYEQERRRAEALTELDRAKTAFFSNVSHEFRTPLTLLLGPVEDLLAGPDRVAPEDRELLSLVHRNALRLQKLVNTLLDFSRIEAGRVRASYEPTDLAALTADLASNFRSACERAGLGLVVDCPPLPGPAYVDRDMWEKVVLNLLSNAFKFTLEGRIEVALRPAGDHVELTVRDTGTGIPPEEMTRLFERFHRVERARGRTQEGSGIGLALVRELVRLHGGEVRAASEPGRGSTFTVTIPLGKEHLPADRIGAPRSGTSTALGAAPYVAEALRWLPRGETSAPAAPAPPVAPEGDIRPGSPPPGPRPRILLADDNADMREYVRRLLADRYEVTAVADGRTALDAARGRAPDLVLSDVMMPGLDGFGLLRELRSDPRTRELPVLLLSARAGEEARVEGMQAGADDYLTKPFGARELLARVEAHLSLARLRREAAAALRASEQRFQAFMDHSPAAAYIKDVDGRFVFVNHMLERQFGRPQADWIGKTDFDFFPADEAEQYRRNDRSVLDSGTTAQFLEVATEADGPHSYLSFKFPIRDDEGHILLAGMSVDITEQKRVEQAVRDSEEKFRRLSESGLVSIAFFATDGRITDANDAFLEMTGYGRDDLAAGRVRWDSLTPPEWMPRTLQAVQEFESTGRIRPYEKEYLRRDGSRFWGLFGGSRLEGRSEGVAFVLDVTDRKRAEQQLREADRRKDEFLATLAHELRNPLAPIRNALHLMAHRGGNGQEIEAERAMAERQVVHLARLIDDLMDVARISRGKIELHARAVDLATVVRQAIETALPQLDERGHRLTVSLPETAVRLEADPTRLEQVLWNLLNNAAKYTEPGGSIGLTVIPDGAEVVIRVRDTGIGLEPEMLPAIFGMFVQVGQHAGRAQGGLGIGLGLVKTLVAMHGGSIAAHSAGPGLGSEFVVRLPILPESRAPAPAPTPPARAEAAARPPRRRILVVDDNVDAANSLAKLLIRIYGQDVRIAHDGLSALDVAVAFRPEVVLLDIGMPGMDGYEVARRLRSRPEFAATRLVALTGWGQQQDRMRSQEAGFDRHLVKPVDPEVVRGLLADAQHFGQIS